MNSLNEVKSSQDSPILLKNGLLEKGEAKGDDVKGAFLALLQGLVGLSNVSMPISALGPEAKVAKLEVKKEELSEKEELAIKEDSFSAGLEDQTSENEKFDLELDTKTESKDLEIAPQTQIFDKTKIDDAKIDFEKKEVIEVAQTTDLIENTKEVSLTSETKINENLVTLDNNQSVEIVSDSNNKIAKNSIDNSMEVSQVVEESSVEIISSRAKKENSQNLEEHKDLPQNISTSLEAQVSEVIEKNQGASVKTKSSSFKSSNLVKDDYLLDPVFEDIRNFILREEKNLLPESNMQLPKPISNKGEAQMNSVKDALIARLLVGIDTSGLATSSRSSSSEVKTSVESVIGLNSKVTGDRVSQNKNATSSFIKRGVQSQEFVDKVKEVLEQSAINKTNDSISVKIDPPHLGEIRVKITHKQGEMYARLTPENKEIENILKTKVNELNTIIQALGFKPEEVHVHIGSEHPSILENKHDFFQKSENSFNREQKKTFNSFSVQKLDVVELNSGGIMDSGLSQESGWVA